MSKMDNSKRALNFVGYGVIIALGYFIQFTPFMIKIFGAYPMPLLMVTVIIAMFESDLCAGIIGLICGLLTDINMINGAGLHAVVYMFAAVLISLLIETLLQNNVLSLVFISIITFFANSGIELLTKSKLTDGLLPTYFNHYFLSAVLSIAFIIPCYLLFALIFGHKLRYKRPVGVINSRLKKYRIEKKKLSDRTKGY